jgi:hypothetical protein
MSDEGPRDDFVGNPWHPFLRVLRRCAANLSPERRSLPIPTPGTDPPPTWDDLFRLDPSVGRVVPTRGLAEAEIRALADWLGLHGEEHATFLELGAAFLAQRDSLREIRKQLWLPEDEDPLPPVGPAAPAPGLSAEDAIPGMETATTTSDCLLLLCRSRQIDLERLTRAVARLVRDFDSRIILLQLRGTLPVLDPPVLEAALAILKAPPAVAVRARALNGGTGGAAG